MREINLVILHASNSDFPAHDNIATIDKWHKERGWEGVGYQYYINKMGHLALGRPIKEPGAHCRGKNSYSIGICLGGKEYFTEMQFSCLKKLCLNLMAIFDLDIESIKPHNYFNKNKLCPIFNVDEFLKTLGE